MYYEIGLFDETVSTLQKAVALVPDAGEIYLLYGQALSKRGDAAQAIVNLREALRLMPDDVTALYTLGKALNDDGRFAEAVEPFAKINESNPNDSDAKSGLGFALMESGNYDHALKILAELDRLRPNNEFVKMLINVANARKKGVADFERIKNRVTDNPKDVEAKKYLSKLYQFKGNLAESERLLQEYFEKTPESAESNNEMAVFYTDARRYDVAIKYSRRAVELKKHHVLYLSLANNLRKLGRDDEAFEAYQKALEVKPNSQYVLKAYADALRDSGKKKQAIEMYKKLLEVEPSNTAAMFSLSLLYLYLLDKPNAQIYYEKLTQYDRNLARNLSWIFKIKK